MPALDGIRALAVLAVMAYHGGLSFLPAGFFGVDAFFVLSGFLITSLLVTEWSTTSGIALRAFWARRARRLLPALLVMLVFVALYARFVAASGTYPGLRWDSIAALFYSANWRFIASGQSYFAQTGPVSPLLHTWSLAIEEQFYIVWPLLVLLIMRGRRRHGARGLQTLLAVSVVGALASALEMAVVFNPASDPTRAYFGTDTHAQCLLVGTALAAGLALWRRRPDPAELSAHAKTAFSLAGVVAVGVCAWAWSQLEYGQTLVFRGGFLIVSVSVAVVIAGAVLHPAGAVSRILSLTPLRFLGRISYGMYLWHFPLDIALTATRTGVRGVPLFLLRTGITVAVSTLSYYALERPIRTRVVLGGVGARIATPAAVLGTAMIVVLSTLSPAAASAGAVTGSTLPSASLPNIPAALAKAPVRVMVVGDSVALTLSDGLQHRQSRWHIDQEDLGVLGCGIALGSVVWADNFGQEEQLGLGWACRVEPRNGFIPWNQAWPKWLKAVRPNLVVLLAGRWEVVDRLYAGHRTNILAPAFAHYVKKMMETAVRIGTSTGARMVLMTAPCYSSGEQPDGTPFPEDDVRRVEAYNRIVREVAAIYPKTVTVQDLFSIACPGGKYAPVLNSRTLRFSDGIHFATDPGTGGDLIAPAILPLWEELGHEQEASGGRVLTGPPPPLSRLSPA